MTASLKDKSESRPVAHEQLDEVVIRFAGDSGDGMQLTGSQFSNTSAMLGNDLSTLPDFPAEIRAPAGTLPGVSAFQVRIADHDIHTPGDAPDVLVAMNPAALKKNLPDLKPSGAIASVPRAGTWIALMPASRLSCIDSGRSSTEMSVTFSSVLKEIPAISSGIPV